MERFDGTLLDGTLHLEISCRKVVGGCEVHDEKPRDSNDLIPDAKAPMTFACERLFHFISNPFHPLTPVIDYSVRGRGDFYIGKSSSHAAGVTRAGKTRARVKTHPT